MVNPHARLRLARSGSGLGSVQIEAPIRSSGVTHSRVEDDDPVWPLLMRALTTGKVALGALASEQRDRLRTIGYLLPPEAVPAEVRFRSTLTDLPEPPPGAEGVGQGPRVAVNATLVLVRGGGVPPGNGSGPALLWDPAWTGGGPLAWLRDPVTGLRYWYELSERDFETLSALASRRMAPEEVEAATRARLLHARILVAEGEAPDAVERVRRHRSDVEARGYTVFPGLLPAGVVHALRRYYQDLMRQGYMAFVDEKRRFVLDEDPVASFFHEQLPALMSQVTGRDLKPSCVLVAAYRGGGVLPPHLDVLPFEWTLSTQIGCEPEASEVWPWPLRIHPAGGGAGGMAPIRLRPGDGL